MIVQANQCKRPLEPITRFAAIATFAVAVAVAILCIAYQCLALTHRYPLDYGEAPLVDQAMRLARGQNIYRTDLSTPPFTISNYPPLYVAALTPFVALFGPSFLPGRLISVVCAWVCAGCIGLIVHRATRDCIAGIVGGLVFLAFPFVVVWSSLARIDLLALALSLAGLCLLVHQPVSRRRLVAAALLLVAAIYTRQSYALAAPLAAFVWLLAKAGFRRALGLTAIVAGSSGALYLALNVATQGGFHFNIVTANVNEWSADRLSWNLDRFTGTAAILSLIGVVSVAVGWRRNPLWPLSTLYLIGAFLSFTTIGKVGSNVNYMLELCAALSIAAGSMVAWSRAEGNSPLVQVALSVLLAIQIVSMAQDTLRRELPQLQGRRAAAPALEKLESIVARAEGPVLADEYMGLLTLQGRPLEIQPFEVTQLALAGLWDQQPVLDGIHDKRYPLILVHYFPHYPVYRERWTPAMLDAINRSYRLTTVLADTGVYEPVGVGVSGASMASQVLERCEGAPWRLPSDARHGVRWDGDTAALYFFGRGSPGAVPVYAVADGFLSRVASTSNRPDMLAIRHDDPLRPGRVLWALYGDLGRGSDGEAFIVPAFAPGAQDVPVQAGQLIGYQGDWSGRPIAMWTHVLFGLVEATPEGGLPVTLTPDDFIDPSPYLGLSIRPPSQSPGVQLLRCRL